MLKRWLPSSTDFGNGSRDENGAVEKAADDGSGGKDNVVQLVEHKDVAVAAVVVDNAGAADRSCTDIGSEAEE
ncbi:hypothetical protein HDU79_011186 [Rhizoclosmatium sp. JEL0117]|nr:hypothetical protein HDU79_011186 [Rhizoclosmatium sp. JEL0117]